MTTRARPPIRSSIAAALVAAASLRAGAAGADDEPAPIATGPGPTAGELSEMSLDELLAMPVTSSSKKEEAVSEAPSVVTALSRDQIRRHRWYTLNDVLGHQPGFAPSRDYDRDTISSRGVFEGWNNNHYLLLVDGVPFNDNLYGTAYTWENTPLFLARSLEILRGPGSALYGSNATAGVLTINTVSPSELADTASAEVRLGTRATRQVDVVAGDERDWLATVVGFSYQRTAGNAYDSYDGSGRTDATGALRRFRIRDGRDGGYLFAKGELGQALEGLSVQLHYQFWSFDTGHGWLWQVPDFADAMHEARQIAVVRYHPPQTSCFDQEYVVRYQRHALDWNMQFLPEGTAGYPAGLSEYLKTHGEDVFARAQVGYDLARHARILGGAETTVFWYRGDDDHHSNANLSGDFLPFPDNASRRVGPWFEWIEDKPVVDVAAFAHASSGALLGSRVTATLGVRYDREQFDYVDITDPARPERGKSFQQVSPRAGVVAKPAAGVSVKALAGRAFRVPAPTELFGANTYTLASNLAELRPELLTSYELAGDWLLSDALLVRGNAYYTQFENQIQYSLQNANLSTNLYSLETIGLESELLVRLGHVKGYVNYAYARRLDEEIFDRTIARSSGRLTWYPAHVANAGVGYRRSAFDVNVDAHFQGKTNRRTSDRQNPTFAALRPATVDPWLTLDVSAGYVPRPHLELSLQVTNLLGSRGYLIKNFDFPFDYRIPGRAAFLSLRIGL